LFGSESECGMTKQATPLLEEHAEETAIAQRQTEAVSAFERMAADPNVSVEKLERLMLMKERIDARQAEMAFNAAMSAAQREIRPIAADAENPQTRSKYASYEALDRALRPIYTQHGFALSFNSGDAPENYVRVLCDVTHLDGHAKPYKLDMPADGKGAKGGDVMTKTHAVGSGLSYGMRYLLKMIFNVAVGEGDDDGNAAGRQPQPKPDAPKGYDDWIEGLEAASIEGLTKLEQAFKGSREDFRNYLRNHQSQKLAALKAVAQKVRA
jgi:hypothetical protein